MLVMMSVYILLAAAACGKSDRISNRSLKTGGVGPLVLATTLNKQVEAGAIRLQIYSGVLPKENAVLAKVGVLRGRVEKVFHNPETFNFSTSTKLTDKEYSVYLKNKQMGTLELLALVDEPLAKVVQNQGIISFENLVHLEAKTNFCGEYTAKGEPNSPEHQSAVALLGAAHFRCEWKTGEKPGCWRTDITVNRTKEGMEFSYLQLEKNQALFICTPKTVFPAATPYTNYERLIEAEVFFENDLELKNAVGASIAFKL